MSSEFLDSFPWEGRESPVLSVCFSSIAHRGYHAWARLPARLSSGSILVIRGNRYTVYCQMHIFIVYIDVFLNFTFLVSRGVNLLGVTMQ